MANSIVDINKIIRPLETSVQNAILHESFVDLKSQIPDDIATYEHDVKEIIDKYLVTLLGEQSETLAAFKSGLCIVNVNIVFFFSGDMITSCKKLLMPLVEEHSKQRAKDIADDKAPKNIDQDLDIVPLHDVARNVGEQYPELLDLQHQHDDIHDNRSETAFFWSTDERSGANNDGPLVEFCRHALYSVKLKQMCSRSVKAELDRLDSTRHGVSLSTHSEGAAKIQNVAESFESSFRTLCHLLQIFSKSLDTIGSRTQQNNSDPSTTFIVNEMKKELLFGCGSCLARLITEYYMFKHLFILGLGLTFIITLTVW